MQHHKMGDATGVGGDGGHMAQRTVTRPQLTVVALLSLLALAVGVIVPVVLL